MDAFDYQETREPRYPQNRKDLLVNLLTIVVLLATVGVIGLFVWVFLDPKMPLNPLPPPAMPELAFFPTETPAPRSLPPTWTPTIVPSPTTTNTPRPTRTPLPTATPFGIASETPDPTLQAGYSFQVQQGNPVPISSAAFHPDYGCAWMGVAGQVTDLSGSPVPGLIVRLGGQLPSQPFDLTTVTGTATQYGVGSFYEFTLTDKPVLSQASLWIQLQDLASVPLSDKVYFDTYADCDRNLVVVNFKQVR